MPSDNRNAKASARKSGNAGDTADRIIERLKTALRRLPDASTMQQMHARHRVGIQEALQSRGDPWGEADILALTNPDREDILIPITDLPLSLGRGDADIVIRDHGVSRPHCRLERRGAMVCVVDLDSKNGTFLNDQQVQSGDLCAGDRLALATLALNVEQR